MELSNWRHTRSSKFLRKMRLVIWMLDWIKNHVYILDLLRCNNESLAMFALVLMPLFVDGASHFVPLQCRHGR